jgi:hypothetical protein
MTGSTATLAAAGSSLVSFAATPAVPSGETSTFDQWGPTGYSNQGLFTGHLTTSAGTAQFAGRRVLESFPIDVADRCAIADPSGLRPALHVSGAGSDWNVLSDSTCADDWIGYDPASTRYYQTYVGSCSLKAPQQQMSISGDNNQWLPYKNNVLEYDVTPTTVKAERDMASGERTYPK